MSHYQKHVVWQGSAGRWHLGLYEIIGWENEDHPFSADLDESMHDVEWDAVYGDRFEAVYSGPTLEAVREECSRGRGNLGIYNGPTTDPVELAQFERMRSTSS